MPIFGIESSVENNDSTVFSYLLKVDDSYVEEEDEDYDPHTCTCNVRAASALADDDDE